MLGSLDMMHNGAMPPFAGTDAERDALSAYLATLYQASPAPTEGAQLFAQSCAVCHQSGPTDPAITTIRSMDPETASESLKNLPALFVRMPDLKLSDRQPEICRRLRPSDSTGCRTHGPKARRVSEKCRNEGDGGLHEIAGAGQHAYRANKTPAFGKRWDYR
jgi:hypothetical protein